MAADPNNSPEAWVRASVVHGQEGRYAEALAACDHALQLHPSYALAYALKGAALTRLNRFDEALAACDRALALDPTSAFSWSSRGDALNELGRCEEALMAYDQALALEPNSDTWLLKGIALKQLKLYEEALAAYDQALQLDPTDCSSCQPPGSSAEDSSLRLAYRRPTRGPGGILAFYRPEFGYLL